MAVVLNKIIEYGILLFVFLIPWQARLILSGGSINGGYWEYGTKSLYATEALLFVVLLAVVIKGIIYVAKNKPRFKVGRLFSPVGALFLLVVFSGVSIFWSIDRGVALERWICLVEAAAVFLIISSGAADLRRLRTAVILSGLAQAGFAIAQFLLQWIPGSTWLGMAPQGAQDLGVSVVETELRRWLRAYGSFPHPNILAGWLVLSLILLTQQLGRISRRLIDVLRYPMFMILMFGLLATFSRGAYLAYFAFFVAFLVVVKWNYFQKIKLVLIAGVVASVFVIGFFEPMAARFSFANRLQAKSNTERISSLRDAWQIVRAHPVLGVGIGNYALAVHQEINDAQEAWYYQPAHNVFLLIWAELGIMGILVILVPVLLLIRHPRNEFVAGSEFISGSVFGNRCRNKHALNLIHGFGMAVLLLPIIIITIFDHYLWSLYAGMLISAVFMGIFWLKLAKNIEN